MAPSTTPVADIKTSDLLDRLVVAPRDGSDVRSLAGQLRAALPGAQVLRQGASLALSPQDAPALLDMEGAEDLRWTPEARLFAENRKWAAATHSSSFQELGRIKAGGRPVAEALLAGLGNLSALDDHQWVNVAAMTIPSAVGLCLYDEQGAGKTVSLIYAFDVLVARNEVDFALIVAPKSMVAEWPKDFSRFTGGVYRVVTAAGTQGQKRAVLRSDPDVVVTNFETAVSMEQELAALLGRFRGRAMLVVDESFYAKNLDASRTRAIKRLRERCGRAFVLCGTPAPNSPHDLVQQFSIVDFGMTFDGLEIPDDREAARPAIQRAIQERGLFVRHLKRDVLPNLPEKQFTRVLVPLKPDQQRLYEGALNDLILDLRSTTDSDFARRLTSFFARRAALLQICSNPSGVVDTYAEQPAKLEVLDALLEDAIVRRGEKVIVWSFFTASIDAIVSRYGRFNPVRYDGTVTDVEVRGGAVERFQDDPSTMLFVGNPAAAGAGLTLHSARIAVYESMSNQAAHYLQSLDRIHRRGQTRDVEYIVLLGNDTIEVLEYDRLVEKERAAQDLLGDRVATPTTRQTMLTELEEAGRLLEGR